MATMATANAMYSIGKSDSDAEIGDCVGCGENDSEGELDGPVVWESVGLGDGEGDGLGEGDGDGVRLVVGEDDAKGGVGLGGGGGRSGMATVSFMSG